MRCRKREGPLGPEGRGFETRRGGAAFGVHVRRDGSTSYFQGGAARRRGRVQGHPRLRGDIYHTGVVNKILQGLSTKSCKADTGTHKL